MIPHLAILTLAFSASAAGHYILQADFYKGFTCGQLFNGSINTADRAGSFVLPNTGDPYSVACSFDQRIDPNVESFDSTINSISFSPKEIEYVTDKSYNCSYWHKFNAAGGFQDINTLPPDGSLVAGNCTDLTITKGNGIWMKCQGYPNGYPQSVLCNSS